MESAFVQLLMPPSWGYCYYYYYKIFFMRFHVIANVKVSFSTSLLRHDWRNCLLLDFVIWFHSIGISTLLTLPKTSWMVRRFTSHQISSFEWRQKLWNEYLLNTQKWLENSTSFHKQTNYLQCYSRLVIV